MTQPSASVAGHLGEFLQGVLGPGGPVALVTLPCPVLQVSARVSPAEAFGIEDRGQGLIEPARAVRFLETLGLRIDGKVTIAAEMPVGGGAGASTAALVALARVAGHAGPPPALAAACVRNEGASDPLMFPRPERLLWASREARIVEGFPALPRMEVVGGFFGPNRRTVAADARFPDIADLVDRWRTAAGAADAPALAALASDSARRTLALRGPSGDPTEALAERLGACGFAIAHTGSARALLFRPGTSGKTAESELIRAGFRQVVRFTVGGFA